jgi:hypothetical protein
MTLDPITGQLIGPLHQAPLEEIRPLLVRGGHLGGRQTYLLGGAVPPQKVVIDLAGRIVDP